MNDQSNLHLLTEAAEITGLTVEALRQRIKRGKLEALKGNDGMLRVRLTSADLEALDRSQTGQKPDTNQFMTGHDRLLQAFEGQAEALRQQNAILQFALDRERARADQAEAEARDARREAAEARQEAAQASETAARLEGEVETLRTALAGAEDRMQVMEEDRTRLWAERDEARSRADQAEAQRRELRERTEVAERTRDKIRVELEAWSIGGPLTRAWHAFRYRRRLPENEK